MNTDIQTKNLSAPAFNSLPPNIKDWAGSLQTTYLIMEINKRLGLKDEKTPIIPSLIFSLITQELDPLEFINELSYELGVSFQTAKSIAQDIENSILKPVENELRKDVGVDVKLIYFGQPSTRGQRTEDRGQEFASAPASISAPATLPAQPNFIKPAAAVPPIPPPPLPPAPPSIPKKSEEKQIAKQPEYKPKEPTVDLQSFEFKSEAPFILHQEGQIYASPSKEIPKSAPSLNIKVQNYYESNQEQKKSAPKPASIKLETPENNQRVVHYSGPTTALNSLGTPKVSDQNTVDLRRLMKPNENTVDLRKKT